MRAAGPPRGKNQVGIAAIRGNPDEVGVLGLTTVKGAVFAIIGVAAKQDNFCAVGRPRGSAVNGMRL